MSVPPKLLVDAASQGLFLFLRTSVARTLTRLYPVAPDNADEWLGQEILRAAGDPGALGVFRCMQHKSITLLLTSAQA